jgi:hypothetical protein
LAAAAFSAAVGIYRRGFIAGVVMGLCTAAIMMAATNPLSIHPRAPSRPGTALVIGVSATTDVDFQYDATLQAMMYGAMAGAAFSGAVGFFRYGLVHGIFLGLCTGAIMIAATIPYWLTMLGITLRLT